MTGRTDKHNRQELTEVAKRKATGKAVKKTGTRGGYREGSGRKPKHEGGTEMVGGRVPVDVAGWIKASGLTQAEAITQAVRESAAYLRWRREQQRK